MIVLITRVGAMAMPGMQASAAALAIRVIFVFLSCSSCLGVSLVHSGLGATFTNRPYSVDELIVFIGLLLTAMASP